MNCFANIADKVVHVVSVAIDCFMYQNCSSFIENRQQLMTVCDKLVNFEVTREQLLEEDTTKVDSTTKCNPPEKRRKVEKTSESSEVTEDCSSRSSQRESQGHVLSGR